MSLGKAKLIGLVLLIASVSALALTFYTAINSFRLTSTNVVIVLFQITIIVPVLFGMLMIGCKLLLYESERIITLEEVRKRVIKKTKKRRTLFFPTIIYFCGIDGSGKTTQMNLIADCLNDRKLKLKYVWLRWAAFFSYPFLAFCRLLGFTKWKTVPRSSRKYAEHSFYRNKALTKVWSALFAVDMFVYSVIKITIPLKFGYTILCDRFVLDALVDLMYETKNFEIIRTLPGRALLSLIPRQSITILFDISEEKAWKRKHDIPSIEYLKQQRKLYLDISDCLKIPVLEIIKSPDEVHEEIVERFLKHHPFWWIGPR
jgi:thymidylate kinase